MQSALDCAGKCDCCDKLQSQINSLKFELTRLKGGSDGNIQSLVAVAVGAALTTQLKPAVNAAVESRNSGFASTLAQMKAAIGDNENSVKKAVTQTSEVLEKNAKFEKTLANMNNAIADVRGVANGAKSTATKSLEEAIRNAREVELAKGLSNQAVTRSGQAITESAKATNAVINAATEATGLRQLVNGIGSRIDGLGRAIGVLESKTATAVANAAKAIGISSEALAATGRLLGRVLELFNLVATIFTLLEQLAVLNTLGDRIDAVENGVVALGNDLSRVLGKLLGLQNRIGANELLTAQVKNIALDAKGIGEAANLKAGAAQVTSARAQGLAESALGNARQAQLTADGAVRNAGIANENATTAYKKANEAQGIGEQAKRIAGDALGKAGVALTTALTAIALYQGVKSLRGLRGLQGIPGIPGRQGERGFQGIQGVPGRDGITTVVQIPGVPGRDGRNGINGINGRNGRDVNPAEAASLRALIIQQHTQTRLNSTTQHSTTRTTILTPIMAALAPILALLKQVYDIVSKAAGAAQLALLNIINNKLGNQVVGGIGGLITRVAENTYIEKVLSVLTFAATVHNALMLSNNLGQTFIQIIDQVTGFLLPKGLDGTPISFTNVLGKAVHEVIADTIGEANYQELSKEWQAANRIYQAASNVFNQISNLGAVVTAGLEVIGGNVGKIGNALKKWGVVGEAAYNFMNPQPNLKGKFFEKLQLTGDNLQAIALVVAVPIALEAAFSETQNSVDTLKREIGQIDPKDKDGNPIRDKDGQIVHWQPGLNTPEPAVVKQTEDQSKADSTNIIQATLDDIFNAND
ncbi:collagen-like triple helix repeat-containing protein [Nostoc sp. DSM 114167]|uniref:collagen-like triple helix repeat-containing protein n=1 Tax=Nostoc sp. DSM 114167 TaxID=3439050 RepID=UPI004045D7FC